MLCMYVYRNSSTGKIQEREKTRENTAQRQVSKMQSLQNGPSSINFFPCQVSGPSPSKLPHRFSRQCAQGMCVADTPAM